MARSKELSRHTSRGSDGPVYSTIDPALVVIILLPSLQAHM